MNLQIIPLKEWGLPIYRFFLVASPCSAESEEQVFETARELLDSGISFLRTGIWKPRTHPGSFEGIGVKGLQWLLKIKQQLGLPVGVEVASPEHVEACLLLTR
jgi:chorismate mutase